MALTLPDAFKNKNIVQNWLFQLHYDDESAFIGTSFYDTTVTNVFYRGVVLNKPSIRESINLEQSKSRTGNVTLTLANFSYLGDDFSAELYGTRKYLNRLLKIYIQPNRVTALSDCLLIYTGKVKSISHTVDTIKLNIEAKRPWDGIEIPSTKTSKNNYYPVSYGDYRPNASLSSTTSVSITTSASSSTDDFRLRKTLYPIPVEEIRGETVFALTGEWTQTSKAWAHYYEKSLDKFIPLANHASTYTTVDAANESYGDGYATRFHKNLLRSTLFKPTSRVSSGTGWASNDNAFNSDVIDTSTYTEFSVETNAFTDEDAADIKFSIPQLTGVPNALSVYFIVKGLCSFSKTSGSGEIRIELINNTYTNEDIAGHFTFTDTGSNNETMVAGTGGNTDVSSAAFISSGDSIHTNWASSGDGWGEDLIVRIKEELQSGTLDGTYSLDFRLYDVFLQATTKLDYAPVIEYKGFWAGSTSYAKNDGVTYEDINYMALTAHTSTDDTDTGTGRPNTADTTAWSPIPQTSGKSEAAKQLDDIKYVYSGADGLPDNGWNSSAAITEIHEAHRDILHRFTSYTNSNTPTNWGSGTNINSIKDWQIRYWINEPTLLINVLEKLQYEGGFIFRFNGQNAGEYVFIPDSISTDHTLGTEDLSSLDISLTDVSKVVARMDIDYRKHPATGGYQTSVSASNSTAISDLLIGTNENKKTIRLDAYVGDASGENDIPTAATSNPNDDWYSYYDQILGSQKIIVKAEVVNPAFYGIDVGDFVAFSDMPVDPFGLSWSGKDFIVTGVTRQIGKLKCEFREV